MKATKFYRLKDVINNGADFHRKKGKYCKKGVYFWGFTLNKNAELPSKKDEIVISYIGKSTTNVVERIMQEFTQLIFGGFGTIIDKDWLINNPFAARLFEKQETDKKAPYKLDKEVLYKSYGLHVLYDFFDDKKIQDTLKWMREHLIFGWIENIEDDDINAVESELHHIVRTNVFGIKGIKNLLPKYSIPNQTPFFNTIDWNDNKILEEWFIEVNKRI